jgi:hypothetical protein
MAGPPPARPPRRSMANTYSSDGYCAPQTNDEFVRLLLAQSGRGAQACRPYLSVTAAATNFLRPALPGLVPWAAHQPGNVAGSM